VNALLKPAENSPVNGKKSAWKTAGRSAGAAAGSKKTIAPDIARFDRTRAWGEKEEGNEK